MISSAIYLLLSIIALGLLIFIHELGHYFMARRVGMRVEAFGIGFGQPIWKWMRDGVEWRLNWIPFGGYVKIKGLEADESVDPYTIPDGFFGRPPLDRIKVSLAGPLANLILAFILFGLLWISGGREKTISEYSAKIGWLDRNSELFADGVRPGDQIVAYGDLPFTAAKDHVYAVITAQDDLEVKGEHIDYFDGTETSFDHTVKVYPNPLYIDKAIKTAGILISASFVVYDPQKSLTAADELQRMLIEGSPLTHSGLEPGDRVLWANGELIFSQPQLSALINEPRTLVTIQRGDQLLLRRIPKTNVQDLRIDPMFRDELTDWQYEAGLQKNRMTHLVIAPYNLTHDAVVEEAIAYIDADHQKQAFPEIRYSDLEEALKPGDKIVAVGGEPIQFSHQLLAKLQIPKVVMIVSRDGLEQPPLLWNQVDTDFYEGVDWDELQKLIQGIGVANSVTSVGKLHLLPPITPKVRTAFALTPQAQSLVANEQLEMRKEFEAIEDAERRSQALQMLDERERQLFLGPPNFQDRRVVYNPTPVALFTGVAAEIERTLKAFITGTLSPKFIAGPVGLVHTIQVNWASGIKEGLFWMGVVSLNLGILNLLPIPVLDGGSICFSLFELVTRRKLKMKTLERFVVPFALLLVMFFIFLTYNDISRILSRFFG
jgi:regulator of sigma E protease